MGRRDEEPPLLWDAEGGPSDAQAPGAPFGEAPQPADDTLTVSQVAERIEAMLGREFPGAFWVVGEVAGHRRHTRGHHFFHLVDQEGDDERSRQALNMKLWNGVARKLFGARGKLPAGFELQNGIVLRVRMHAEWDGSYGQLSFHVEDVDPEYTLGTLDRHRQEVLDRLRADGSLETNKALPLPEVPLRIGLVTAVGSAAYNDVMAGIERSGFGIQLLVCDARVQGPDTSPTVRAALATLAARAPDCIVLCRGGGSRLDLSWFDREDIARAIAACPVPVLTGIGHEIDTSVADAVAHTAFKTPTMVAEFLVERGRHAVREIEQTAAGILRLATGQLAAERAELLDTARRTRSAARGRLAAELSGLIAASQRLRGSCEARLSAAGEMLVELRSRLARGRHMERLSGLSAALQADGRRLAVSANAVLDRQAASLESAEAKARLLDPRGVLKRGFAWLARPDGALLKDAAAASEGETLTAVLRDGELDLHVDRARPAPGPGAHPTSRTDR